jgi:hypothetical protein
MGKFGFSFCLCVNRAVGITRVKRRLAHAAGIPTTRTGRQAKMGKMVTGGCVTPILLLLDFLLIACGAATPTASGILQPSSLPDAPPAPPTRPTPQSCSSARSRSGGYS